MKKTIVTLTLASTILTSCQGNEALLTRQNVVTGLGAIGGGVLGSNVGKGRGRILGAAVGTLAGAAVGSWLGANLDPKDQQMHATTTQRTLETARIGQRQEWSDPNTGAGGYIVPERTFQENGRNCREYTQTVHIGGKQQSAHGTACRTSHGDWEIVN